MNWDDLSRRYGDRVLLVGPRRRLTASVAAFTELLKNHPAAKGVSLDAVAETVEKAVSDPDRPEDAVEFFELAKRAAGLKK